MSNNPVRLQSGDGIPITQTNKALDVNVVGGITATTAEMAQKVQTHVNIVFATTTAQTIIAAPGSGKRIWLTRLSLTSDSNPQVNVKITLKSGTTAIETIRGATMVFDYPEHRNLGDNEAFVIQCATADPVIGGLDYYVEVI